MISNEIKTTSENAQIRENSKNTSAKKFWFLKDSVTVEYLFLSA